MSLYHQANACVCLVWLQHSGAQACTHASLATAKKRIVPQSLYHCTVLYCTILYCNPLWDVLLCCHGCSNREVKRARKEAAKGERQKALEEKRSAIDAMLEAMTEEQREEWRQKQKVCVVWGFLGGRVAREGVGVGSCKECGSIQPVQSPRSSNSSNLLVVRHASQLMLT
jgi:hypothetical protein